MHPFHKLREAGPMTPAQVAVVLNRDVLMHTPLLIKPLVGRELVAIVIAMSTQSRDDPGAYVLEDYPPPMARHGRRTQAREPGAPDRRRERTAAGAHGRIPAVSGSQNIEKSADGSERRQAAGRLVGLSGGNRKVIRSATLAAAQFDVRVGDLHERKSLLPAPRPSPGRPICRSCTRSWRPCRRSSAWPPTTAATPTSTVGAISSPPCATSCRWARRGRAKGAIQSGFRRARLPATRRGLLKSNSVPSGASSVVFT